MKIQDKIRVLLPHWIEHNQGHGQEFGSWADQLETDSPKIATLLRQAAAALDEADKNLSQALELAGGPLDGHHHH